MNPDRLLVSRNNAFIGTRKQSEPYKISAWRLHNHRGVVRKQLCTLYFFITSFALVFVITFQRHFITFTWYFSDGTWGKESPPSPASLPDICAGRWRFAGEGERLAGMVSLSFELGFVSLSLFLRRRAADATDGDKRLFLARSRPSFVRMGGTQSANQSISFAVLMLRMVSRIRSTSAKEERRHQINL